ncbi:MAG: DUF3482 domain-containing protein [Verrucomicrobia bacterium]|nr:DUF3482 domain-containing protein [Verrucomicrobiota bacterium]
MLPVPDVPTFAVAGQPNEGKTTVLATLAEDDQADIGPLPGTTTRCVRYPVEIDGAEIMVFFDTPGFQEPAAVLAWFQQHLQVDNPAAAFLEAHGGQGRFPSECEIMKPLAQGAAVIYVVDASRPVRSVDRLELEILRLCGNPRIAVIYQKETGQDYVASWTQVLARDFNLRRSFNAHHATFRERMELLAAAKTVIQEWQPSMEGAIAAFQEDWDERLRRTADHLCGFLREVLLLREVETLAEAGAEREATAQARERLRGKVRQAELAWRRRIRKTFRHRRENWNLPEIVVADVFSRQVWRCLGLSKPQLILAGAFAGAVVGGSVDVMLGGASLLAVTGLSASAGAVLSWLSADRAVNVKVPRLAWGPWQVGGRQLGGVGVEARVDPRSNLVWILIDRAWAYLEAASLWSHGRRYAPVPLGDAEPSPRGFSAGLTRAERETVIRFIGQLRKSTVDPAKLEAAQRAVRDLWEQRLRQRTLGQPGPVPTQPTPTR